MCGGGGGEDTVRGGGGGAGKGAGGGGGGGGGAQGGWGGGGGGGGGEIFQCGGLSCVAAGSQVSFGTDDIFSQCWYIILYYIGITYLVYHLLCSPIGYLGLGEIV